MSRNKRSSMKHDKPSTSDGASRVTKDEDLAYYVHDRVELMRQVFTILSPKEIKSMAPACVRKLSNDELEEICLDELLGISSKRVCAIIDGAEPPSETSSSESEQSDDRRDEEPVDVVDLDSLSDASVWSTGRAKKKRSRKTRRESDKDARGAGSTVLELLELQARARALKAQLEYQNALKEQPAQEASDHDEVEVKEEAPVVLEISSDEEKPDLHQLGKPPDIPPEKPPPPPKQKKKKKQKSKERSPKATDVHTDKQNETMPPAKDVARSELTSTKSKKAKKKKYDKQSKTKDDKQKEVINEIVDKKNDDVVKKDDDIDKKDESIVIIDDDEEETSLEPPPSKVTTDAINVNSQKELDFRVTIPQGGPTTRKIQLDKNNVFISVPNVASTDVRVPSVVKQMKKINSCVQKVKTTPKLNYTVVIAEKKKETKKVKYKGKKRKVVTKEIDHDEIELQLSESEKVDLLEDLDSKNLEKIDSSSDSEDSSKSSDTDNDKSSEDVSMLNVDKDPNLLTAETTNMNSGVGNEGNSDIEPNDSSIDGFGRKDDDEQDNLEIVQVTVSNEEKLNVNTVINDVSNDNISRNSILETNKVNKHSEITLESLKAGIENVNIKNICVSTEQTIEVSCLDDIPVVHEEFGPKTYEELSLNVTKTQSNDDDDGEKTNTDNLEVNVSEESYDSDQSSSEASDESSEKERNQSLQSKDVDTNTLFAKDKKELELIEDRIVSETTEKVIDDKTSENDLSNESSHCDKQLEEGELHDHSDSEVEAFEVQPEIVCISDEDGTETEKTKKKKSKKQKKVKKCKKDRKMCSDNSDQNFYRQKNAPLHDKNVCGTESDTVQVNNSTENEKVNRSSNDSDVFEILDLSDDSSCYEVEGVSVLSKEPTSEEIEALSAKIDQFQRVDVITGEHIEFDEKSNDNENVLGAENISWKDRYLDSKKVKRVLSTSNILNAIRKKNKELKRKMQESKKIEDIDETQSKETEKIEEGSIDHFNMLQGSTKYVHPVPEQIPIENKDEQIKETETVHINLTNEMQKDAKQLLKMYKRLLKYNDLNKQKQKDPNKKKKSKKSKKKKDAGPVSNIARVDNT